MDSRTLTIADTEDGQRLDRTLVVALSPLSRSRIQALIKDGHVRESGRTVEEPGHRVKQGMVVEVDLPEPEPALPLGEAIPLTVVFEDKHLIVIDKPAGLVVHPAPGHSSGTLVNALIAHCGASLSGIGGVRRPGIVHRLDKDTSGLLVVAKNDRAHQGLSEQFAAHGLDGALTRVYQAVVWGKPERRVGTVSADLGRSTMNRAKISVLREGAGGRHAVTHFEVEETFDDASGKTIASLLSCRLETGRTHQIRVHMAHIGHAVLGDAAYGTGFQSSARNLAEPAASALATLRRQALHAASLGFIHPVSGKPLQFTSPLPSDMAELLVALRQVVGPAKRRPTKARQITKA